MYVPTIRAPTVTNTFYFFWPSIDNCFSSESHSANPSPSGWYRLESIIEQLFKLTDAESMLSKYSEVGEVFQKNILAVWNIWLLELIVCGCTGSWTASNESGHRSMSLLYNEGYHGEEFIELVAYIWKIKTCNIESITNICLKQFKLIFNSIVIAVRHLIILHYKFPWTKHNIILQYKMKRLISHSMQVIWYHLINKATIPILVHAGMICVNYRRNE